MYPYPYQPGGSPAPNFPGNPGAPGAPAWRPDPYREELFRAQTAEQRILRRRSSWTGWAVLASLLLLNVLFTGCFLLLPTAENSAAYFMEVTFAYTISFALSALLLTKALNMPLDAALPMQKTGVLTAIAAVLFGAAACNLANYPANIVAMLLDSAGLSGAVPEYGVDGSALTSVFLVLASCVVPALVEEFLYRGVILRALMRFGTGFAILTSSLLFALMHGNLSQIIFAFPLGLLFAILVVRTGNLWITIVVHFLNNFLSSLYLIVSATAGTQAADLYSTIFPPVLWVLGAVGLAYLLIHSRGTFFRLSPPRTLLPHSMKASGFFGNPGIILFLCYTAFSCVLYLISS